jgi:hypothetical protein
MKKIDIKEDLLGMEGKKMLTTTLITILERLLSSGLLTTALATLFKKALTLLGV